MAWHVWYNLKPSDYMDIGYIQKFQSNIAHIVYVLNAQAGIPPPKLAPILTDRGWNQDPTPAYINAIEENIETLRRIYGWQVEFVPTVTWVGEDGDLRHLDYTDVNRWFKELSFLRLRLEATQNNKTRCGQINCAGRKL